MIINSRIPFRKTAFLFMLSGQFCAVRVFSQPKKPVEVEVSLYGSYFVNLTFDDAGWGYGGSTKFLFSMEGNDNHITAGLIADRMKESDYSSYSRSKAPVYTLVNAVGGYRKSIRQFFIEPQVGVGIFHEKDEVITWSYDVNGNITGIYEVDDRSRTVLNIFPGIESGFHLNKLTCSFNARFNYADPFKEFVYAVFSIKAGYRLGKRTR